MRYGHPHTLDPNVFLFIVKNQTHIGYSLNVLQNSIS